MLDKNKIRLMSRLAIYDKKYGAFDRKKSGYFKWDYIYFRNFWTRLGVFSGCFIITILYALNKMLVDQADVMALDFKAEATKIAFFTILVLVIYTIIGTAVAKNEYKKSRERLDAYFSMLDKLDKIRGTAQGARKERVEPKRIERAGNGHQAYRPPQTKTAHTIPPELKQSGERINRWTEQDEIRQKRTFTNKGYSPELMSRLKEVKRHGNTDSNRGENDIWKTDDYNGV